MVLSDYKVGAGLAVSDMARSGQFYEGKLGLSVSIDSPGNVRYRYAGDSVLRAYLSPSTRARPPRPWPAGASTPSRESWRSSAGRASPSSATTKRS
jgi:hypothetical protein